MADNGSGRVYLDTSVVIAALFPGIEHHDAAQGYCQSLFESNNVVCYSILLHVEFLNALRRIGSTPGIVSGSARRRHRLQHWGRLEQVREDWLRHGLSEFDALVSEFYRVEEFAITSGVLDTSTTLMARYNLKSNDAIHLATARSVGGEQLATLDADFAAVAEPPVAVIRA